MGKANLVVGQSGGPTCVINSSLYGVIKEAIKNEKIDKVFGALNGVNGLINDRLVTLNDLDNEELNYEFDDIRLLWIKENAEVKETHNEYEELSKWAEKGISILNKREKI